MTRLGLRPYRDGDLPEPASVPVTVVVLAQDEEVNIARCLSSVAWARQVIVVDSGSTDGTAALSRAGGADVVRQPWLGFGAQREFALRMPLVCHDWVYFVDADEWVSPELATEVAVAIGRPEPAAYAHRFRLVFQGRWIRHCGWYAGSRVVRLMRRDRGSFGPTEFGERPRIDGEVGRLTHDIVDEDLKGLAQWLRKHIGYAELEAARRRGAETQPGGWLDRFSAGRRSDGRPFARAVLKDLVFPLVPARPLALFCYMYVIRGGFLDGLTGLRFCLYHAWFQVTVDALRAEDRRLRPPRYSGVVQDSQIGVQ